MKSSVAVHVVVVGLIFGEAFLHIYARHPNVASLSICDTNGALLEEVGLRHNIQRRFSSLEAVLEADDVDAVHLLTPVGMHAAQAVQVLDAGKHCASAVPMGLSIAELELVLAAEAANSTNYMMMETAVYSREYLYTKALLSSGEMGGLTFLRGVHIRDRSSLPPYWRGFPPLLYSTHAVAPLLDLAGARAASVQALGSGFLAPENRGDYGNPYALETALFRLAGTTLAAEVTQGSFQVARKEQEGFSVYGENASVEWPQIGQDGVLVFRMPPNETGVRMRPVDYEYLEVPDPVEHLPLELRELTRRTIFDPGGRRAPFPTGGLHGGAHAHLVHEFVMSIVEARPPTINAATAAEWTAAGICGHESAMREGERVTVPSFTGGVTDYDAMVTLRKDPLDPKPDFRSS